METLGIDLGTNSIGWAILNENKGGDGGEIKNAGVLVFEEGVDREQSDSLETPAATRRRFRMARRLRFRRKIRRWHILRLLIENGMCPLTIDELHAWKQNGVFPSANEAFLEWLKSTDADNPYCDRAAAAEGKVAPEILGRAIFHISQRRGFKSSRKEQLKEKEAESGENKKEGKRKEATAEDKELGDIKKEIKAITLELERTGLTLGQYFHRQIKAGKKVRKLHTGRIEHYEKEWGKIAETQGLEHGLAEKITRILFYQRPLREQSYLVGKCPLAPKYKRAQLGHPDFEEFRALSFVNNIKYGSDDSAEKTVAELSEEQRKVAMEFFIRKTPFDFKDVAKKIEKEFKDLRGVKWNYDDSIGISPSKTTAALRELVPPESYQKAFDALTYFDDLKKLEVWVHDKLGLSSDDAGKFVKIRVTEGRANYSLFAIRKILPFLREGFELSQAKLLAGLPYVLGREKFDTNRVSILQDMENARDLRRKDARTKSENDGNEFFVKIKPLREYLWITLEKWFDGENTKMKRDLFDSLWFHEPNKDDSYANLTVEEEKAKKSGILPSVKLGMIRNPLVQRSMTMLRKLVNELRRNGDIDADTRIHIELARDVNDRNTRMAIADWNKGNEKKRAEAEAKLKEFVGQPSDEEILKYILWEEQDHTCLYTGKNIGIKDLLSSDFEIEHTIPRARSGDDSQENKTLCDTAFNRIKGNKLPTELAYEIQQNIHVFTRLWREKIDVLKKESDSLKKKAKCISDNPEAKSRARQKFLKTKMELGYWSGKVARFAKTAEDVTPAFMNRQLVDTGIMCRHAVALLQTVYSPVYPVNGVTVALARKEWGAQNQDAAKNRNDHRHHAVDAMVIAALDRRRFNEICAALKKDESGDIREGRGKTRVPAPFADFAQKVYDLSQDVVVKHHARHNELKPTKRNAVRLREPRNKDKNGKLIRFVKSNSDTIRGQLHKETFYGQITHPIQGEKTFVVRKELNSGNFKQSSDLEKIVDRAVKKAIVDEIGRRGGDFKKAIDEGGFKMPGERGAPIKKVRIEARVTNPLKVREHTATPSDKAYKNNYFVEPAGGSNFRLAVFNVKNEFSSLSKIEFRIDNLFHVASNPKAKDATKTTVVDEDAQLLGYIRPGAMAITIQRRGEQFEPKFDIAKRLYEVVKYCYISGKPYMTLVFHKEARRMVDLEKTLGESGKNKKGQSGVDYEEPHEMLLLNLSKWWATLLFEGIHFKMGLDGGIQYLEAAYE